MLVRKVLHVIPSVAPVRGGPTTLIRGLARGLRNVGVETHVATTNDDGAGRLPVRTGVPCDEDGVTYWYFQRQTQLYTFSWPLAAWLFRHIHEFDIVHVHALFSFPTIPAAFWAHRRGVPYVVRPLGTLNDWGMQNRRPWLKRLSFRLIERRVLEGSAFVHYTSDQEQLEASGRGVVGRSHVIPNPVVVSSVSPASGRFRARYPDLADRPIVLFLSRLHEKKGLNLLLRAFRDIREAVPRAVLVVAGTGDLSIVERLHREADALGVSGDLVWTGHLGEVERQDAFADASLFVLPSYSENFGIAVVEAMAAGVPVVISNCVGIHDQVAAAGAGLVVNCDAMELSRAIAAVLTSPARREAMASRARALAHENFSLSAVTQRLIEAYDNVIAETSRMRHPQIGEQPCSTRSLP